MTTRRIPKPCPPKPTLKARPLLSAEQSAALAELFKVLANDTRLRLLHVLARHGEVCVGDLAGEVDMKPQAVSNQLRLLQRARIAAARRDGTSIYYRIVDRCVPVLLDRGLCLLEESEKRRASRRNAVFA